MDSDRIYYSELKCYAEATEKQRKITHTSAFYDMSGIGSEGLKKELKACMFPERKGYQPYEKFFGQETRKMDAAVQGLAFAERASADHEKSECLWK